MKPDAEELYALLVKDHADLELERQRIAAERDQLNAELDEIALATGYGERPEGQSGVHRAGDLAARLGKLSGELRLHLDMRCVAESTVAGVAKWLGMDEQGIFEDPSSVVLAVRAAQRERDELQAKGDALAKALEHIAHADCEHCDNRLCPTASEALKAWSEK